MKLKTLMLICAVFLMSCITLQANESRLSTLRKTHLKQLKILKHIHEQQQIILLNTLKNPALLKPDDFNKPFFRSDLRFSIQQLPKNLKKIKKFAFLDKMHIIDQVVLDIQSGKIQYEKCKEKDPVKILKYIQRKQRAALRMLQKAEVSRRTN